MGTLVQREIKREFNSDIRVRICKRRYGRKLREGVENKVG
jgi:hypothetical protein